MLHIRIFAPKLTTMAFGFPAQEVRYLPQSGGSNALNRYLAFRVCRELRWSLIAITETSVTATTLNYAGSWNETFTLECLKGEIALRSASNGNQVYDAGRNGKNIDLFINAFNSLKKKSAEITLEETYLEASLQEQAALITERLKPTLVIKQFYTPLSILIPAPGYTFTPALIGINILLWIIMVANGVSPWYANPEQLVQWGANFTLRTLDGEWWRLGTALFLHANLFHLLSNAIGMALVGLSLEPFLGKKGLLALYLSTGLVASSCSLFWNENIVCIGASGAVFGLFGFLCTALLFRSITHRMNTSAWIAISVFVGLNLIGSFEEGIDAAAHLGGFGAGILWALGYHAFRTHRLLQHSVLALVFTLIIIGGNAYTYTSLQPRMQLFHYWTAMEEFAQNESIAIDSYQYDGPSTDEYLEQLEETGLVYWRKNKTLLNRLNNPTLPKKIRTLNENCIAYCTLHEQFIRYKIDLLQDKTSVEKPLETMDMQIESIGSRIRQQIQEIAQEYKLPMRD